MSKSLSAVAIHSLKEALIAVYWYKSDLRSFLSNCISDKSIISSINWELYKRQIVSDVLDDLTSNQDKYMGDIRRLIYEVSNMENFDHLTILDDGAKKAQKARAAVHEIKKIVNSHDKKIKDDEQIIANRKIAQKKLISDQAVSQKLQNISNEYVSLISSTNHQSRGYDLEKIMNEIFDLFDLDPKASFKIKGEQIDGSFSLEGTDYLFEARWKQKPADTGDLDTFSSKVERKLDNTLGLFLSINGYTENSVTLHSTGRPTILLMTGADLMAVLEQRIDLVMLLKRKKRHASQTGNILLQIHEMIQ